MLGQGSITEEHLKKIIFIGRKNILDAEEFIERYKQKTFSKTCMYYF